MGDQELVPTRQGARPATGHPVSITSAAQLAEVDPHLEPGAKTIRAPTPRQLGQFLGGPIPPEVPDELEPDSRGKK
jgi:hypothetical protein